MGGAHQGRIALDVEGHHRPGAVDDGDVLDRADLHPGDPDVVALDQAGGVDELRLVVVGRAEADVADHDRQHAGRQRGDHHEDHQLDQCREGAAVEAGHRSDTFAPRAIGPTSSCPRSGTSSADTPSEGASRLSRIPASPGPPAYPVPRVQAAPYPGATRSVPLPVGELMPSTKFGWWRTGLDWLHGAFGRCRQFGPRLSPYTGLSAGV